MFSLGKKTRCVICGKTSKLISSALELCADCIRNRPEQALKKSKRVHAMNRLRFGLPPEIPKGEGVRCRMCANECSIPEGKLGYCGLRKNIDGRLIHLAGTPEKGIVQCYHDPLPTNCVAIEFCAGGSEAGYPEYSYSQGVEYGYKNLAVFYGACSFNCLFCQNWHYRKLSDYMSAKELAEHVDEKTSCICFFGGDPSPQMPHAIATSELAMESKRILRICWETNGNISRNYLKKAAELSLESGGTIKFDLKAWDENLHIALCGVSNRHVLKNFEWLANYGMHRQTPPFLTASTLLIPGYVEVKEVEHIAEFISSLNENIPYTLLAFYPMFCMEDMPLTSKELAMQCLHAAEKYLNRVRVGNIHLLS